MHQGLFKTYIFVCVVPVLADKVELVDENVVFLVPVRLLGQAQGVFHVLFWVVPARQFVAFVIRMIWLVAVFEKLIYVRCIQALSQSTSIRIHFN